VINPVIFENPKVAFAGVVTGTVVEVMDPSVPVIMSGVITIVTPGGV
jgi:hypothetical protein